MNGVFVDSNVIIHHLAGDNKAKAIIENVESGGDTGYINQIVVSEVIARYGLLPNDALIAATCKHHGIMKLATFNGDFKQVDFVEIIK